MEFMNLLSEFLFFPHNWAGTQGPTSEGMAKVTSKVQMTNLLFIEQTFFEYPLSERHFAKHEAFTMRT